MEKKNVIIADCNEEEIKKLVLGLKQATDEEFEIETKVCNGKRTLINNIIRYIIYIFYPLKFVLNKRRYKCIIGWQQFFTLFFVFYCRIFRLRKNNIVVTCNFTYKPKKGIVGKIYKRIMYFCVNNEYLDYIHVPSNEYATICSEEFNIEIDKFIITRFGIDDPYEKWKNSTVEYENYSLAIGRSNRDYDFLIDVWKDVPDEYKLVIISDQYETNIKLPSNVILKKDITGDKQFPYIANCNCIIIPIDDGKVCSGDTVLLKGMSFYKTVIVTTPSTLSEMYLINEKNGICVEKEKAIFRKTVLQLLNEKEKLERIGREARNLYINEFSRENMGRKIGEKILK